METNTPETGSVVPEVQTEHPENRTGSEPALIADKYKTQEDLINAHKELEKKFHEVSAKAKDAEKLQGEREKFNKLATKYAESQGIAVDEAINILNEEIGVEKPDALKEVEILRSQMTEMKFLNEHPESKEYVSEIKAIAKDKGITLEEALNEPLVKRTLELEKKLNEREQGTSVIESNKRITTDKGQIVDTFNRFKKSSGEGRSKAFVEVLKARGIV